MPKPDWLKESEKRKRSRPFITCGMCAHLGKPVKEVKVKVGKKVLYECAIHSKCINSESSIRCGDWQAKA